MARSLVALTLLGLGPGAAPAPATYASPPGEPANLEVEGAGFSAVVVHQTECCPKKVEIAVQRPGGEPSTLRLEGRLQRLRALELVGDGRLLVIGELRYGGTGLWIADLETLSQETEIWNYGHSVSPSGVPRVRLPRT